VLLGTALRQQLEKNIEEAKKIANQANAVLAELEKLTEEGRKLTTDAS
jgi:hypothetical protein